MSRANPSEQELSDYSVIHGCHEAVKHFRVGARRVTAARIKFGVTRPARKRSTFTEEFKRECVMYFRKIGRAETSKMAKYKNLNPTTINSWDRQYPKELFDTSHSYMPHSAHFFGVHNDYKWVEDLERMEVV